MSFCVFDRAHHPCALRTLFPKSVVLVTSALLAALLNACGGNPVPPAANASPTTTPQPSLTVSASLPAATVGTSYSATVTATGGAAPYYFFVASGNLPSGVTLANSTGVISGTPSGSGNFNFVIAVSDSKGGSGKKSLQIAVADATATSSGGGSGSSGGGTSGSGGSGSGSGGSSGSGSSGGTGSGSSGGSSGGGTSSGGGSPSQPSFSNVQKSSGWAQYGQGPPNFVDCSPSPCNGIDFSMTQGINSPSMSGSSTVFYVGGTTPYSDALWNNHLIGPLSSQGTFDSNGTIVPNLHDFTYDVYFYGDNLGAAEAIEFDINQFFNGVGLIYGHECRIAAGNQWDVWNNATGQWVPTGVPCYPNSNAWNHLTLKVQRTSDNHETYQSITLNGQTYNLNWSLGHGTAGNWYGVTVNFQLDGNYQQTPYKVYVDNLTLSYQ